MVPHVNPFKRPRDYIPLNNFEDNRAGTSSSNDVDEGGGGDGVGGGPSGDDGGGGGGSSGGGGENCDDDDGNFDSERGNGDVTKISIGGSKEINHNVAQVKFSRNGSVSNGVVNGEMDERDNDDYEDEAHVLIEGDFTFDGRPLT